MHHHLNNDIPSIEKKASYPEHQAKNETTAATPGVEPELPGQAGELIHALRGLKTLSETPGSVKTYLLFPLTVAVLTQIGLEFGRTNRFEITVVLGGFVFGLILLGSLALILPSTGPYMQTDSKNIRLIPKKALMRIVIRWLMVTTITTIVLSKIVDYSFEVHRAEEFERRDSFRKEILELENIGVIPSPSRSPSATTQPNPTGTHP